MPDIHRVPATEPVMKTPGVLTDQEFFDKAARRIFRPGHAGLLPRGGRTCVDAVANAR